MREMEIVAEALKYILREQQFAELINYQWRLIIDFRNVLAHQYFGLNFNVIVEILSDHLPVFERDFLNFVDKASDKEILIEAIDTSKIDLKEINRKESIDYLDKIKEQILNT